MVRNGLVFLAACGNPSHDKERLYKFKVLTIFQVPVLRIFGPASDGHKACIHIHGVFPYFYVPCPTRNPEPQFLYQVSK